MNNASTKFKTQFSENNERMSDADTSRMKRLSFAKRALRFLFKTQKRSLVVIVFIGAVGYGGYAVFHRPTPEEKAAQELTAAVATVGQRIILPEDDKPVLATVTDAQALIREQTFFTGAINGDQLLMYPKNLKAIIWSPSRKMIVNAGPIQQSPAARQEPVTEENKQSDNAHASADATALTLEVRNGTDTSGKAANFAQEIRKVAGYVVLDVSDADKKDYARTIIYVKNKNTEKIALASALASSINATPVSDLPPGEKNTNADVLVIVGEN